MEKPKIKLIAPSIEMKTPAMAFRQAFLTNGESKINGSCGLHHFDRYESWLEQIKNAAQDAIPGRIPSTTYFAVLLPGNVIVGVTDIRHYLTEETIHNGHIGYAVRPEERRKGHGTAILRLALIKAYELGIIEAVVCCNKGNRASRRVIERNGLQRDKEILEENGNIVLVYTKIL